MPFPKDQDLLPAFENFDSWTSTLPESRRAQVANYFKFTAPENLGEERKHFLNVALISQRTGRDAEEVSRNLETLYIPAVSIHKDGLALPSPAKDANDFYEKARQRLTFEKTEKEDRMAGVAHGYKSAVEGLGYFDALSSWTKAGPDMRGGREVNPAHFTEGYNAVHGIINPMRPELRAVVKSAKATMTGEASDSDATAIDSFQERLLDMPEEKQQVILGSLAAMMREAGKGAEKGIGGAGPIASAVSGFAQEMGEGAGRFMSQIGAQEEDRFLLKVPITGKVKTSLAAIDSPEKAKEFLRESIAGLGAGSVKEMQDFNFRQKGERELTAEESALIATAKERQLQKNQLMRQFATLAESADPVGKISGSMGASLGIMGGMIASKGRAAPIVWQMYAGADYNQIRLEHPEIPAERAMQISQVAGAAEAALDMFEASWLTKMPSVKAALKGGLRGVAMKALPKALGVAAVENIQEGGQDLLLPVTQEVFHAFVKDVPGLQWMGAGGEWEKWVETRADVFVSLLPLLALGSGVATYRDIKGVKTVLSRDAEMKQLGLQEPDRIAISEAAQAGKTDAATALLREAWGRRSPEVAAEFQAGMTASEVETQNATAEMVRRGMLPDIRRDGSGYVVTADGKSATFSTWEQARDVASQHMNEREIQQADLVASMADSLNLGEGESIDINQRGETMGQRIASGVTTPEDALEAAVAAGILKGMDVAGARSIAKAVFGGESADERSAEIRKAVESIVVMGSNRVTDGKSISTVSLQGNEAPFLTVVEETVEGRWKGGVAAKRFTKAQGVSWVKMAEAATGESFTEGMTHEQILASAEETPRALTEAISRIVVADVLGRMQSGQRIAPGSISRGLDRTNREQSALAAILDAFREFFKTVLDAASKLMRAREDGKLGADYDALFDALTGGEGQHLYEQETLKEQAEFIDTSGYSEDTPGPNGETFSLAAADGELVTVHNLSIPNLRHAIRMGGLAVPSVAIIRTDVSSFDSFGDVTLIAPPGLIDPQSNRESKVFNADVYSPRYPSIKLSLKEADTKAIAGAFKPYYAELSTLGKDSYSYGIGNLIDKIKDDGFSGAGYNSLAAYAFARETGKVEAPSLETDADAYLKNLDVLRYAHKSDDVSVWLEGFVRSLGVRPEEKIPNGFTYSGKRRYLPHTLDVVVKLMKKKLKDGEGFNYGVPSIRATNAKPFRTLKSIKAASGSIIKADEMEALKEQTSEEFATISAELAGMRSHGGGIDSIADDFKALAEGGAANYAHLREMYDSLEDAAAIMRPFLDKLRHMPTEYFEGKIQRAVDLSEFSGAVMPDDSPADVVSSMKLLGVQVVTYKDGDKQARAEAVKAMAATVGATFSLVTPAQDTEYMAAVESGDMATAQTMVDEAAKAAGYGVKAYHGTSKNFKIFKAQYGRALWFSEDRAKIAAGEAGAQGIKKIMPVFLRTGRAAGWKEYNNLGEGQITRDFESVHLDDDWIIFAPENVKSAEPVTRERGEVVPLSKRFNPESNRITFSLRSADFAARMEAAMSPFNATPEARQAMGKVALERVQRVGAEWIVKAAKLRGSKSINKEAAMREAKGYEERVAAYIDSLSEGARQALEWEPSKLADEPLIAAMLGDVGRLMSRSKALELGKFDLKSGDYDGAPWLPPSFYSKGAGLAPDKMAQALYDLGMLPDAYTDTLWSALAASIASVRKDRVAYSEASRAYSAAKRAARADSKAEVEAWANQERQKAGSNKTQRDMLKGGLRTLDALLSAFPPEVRVKVGGYVKLAGLATDEAMLDEIERRIVKLEEEATKWLRKEGLETIELLFKKAAADYTAGKKAKGKIGADEHHILQRAEAASRMTGVQVLGEIANLDARIESGELTTEQEILARVERSMIELAGNLFPRSMDSGAVSKAGRPVMVRGYPGADVGRLYSAIDAVRDLMAYGAWSQKQAEIAKRERWTTMREALIEDTGKEGSEVERREAAERMKTLVGKSRAALMELSSFNELLAHAFGSGSAYATAFVDAERDASNDYEDEIQEFSDELDALFTRLAGGKVLDGERLRFDMSQPSITAGTSKLSQLEAIQALLMWRQEDGRRHMEGNFDENGKLTSSWGYDQSWIDTVTNGLTSEGLEVFDWIARTYSVEHAEINPLYRRRNGVNMPKHANYAPVTVTPMQAKASDTVNPLTGAPMNGGILSPGSLRTRSTTAVAEPKFRDAVATIIAHKKMMGYWKHYYDVALEANAILGNREVANAVEAKIGAEGVLVLSRRLSALAMGGVRDASAGLALTEGVRSMTNRAATIGLLGRVSTLLIQSTQLAASSVKMPVGAYLSRFGKLMTGNLAWGDAIRSEFIQRRIKSAPPIVRQAMQNLASAKRPNEITRMVRRLGEALSNADGLFTAGTYAILLDYHRTTGAKLGLSGAELESHATAEATRETEQVAQPTRDANRSFRELAATDPLAKIAWAYASEARQKIALFAWAALDAKNKPGYAAKTAFLAFGIGGLLSQIIKNSWRELGGDDDEKKWSIERLVTATLTSPLHGVPVVGSLLGDGNMLSGFSRAGSSWERITSLDYDDPVQVMRDIDVMLSAAGLFNDNLAGLSAASHIGLDLSRLLQNAFGE